MTSLLAVAIVLMTGACLTTATEYVVEVYFVVEPQVIRNYQNLGYDEATAISTISSDVDYFVHQVNEMFGSLNDFSLDVEIRAKHVKIMGPTEEMFGDCMILGGTDLQSDMAMEVFKHWLQDNNIGSVPGYDMAVVWTGYDLFSTAGNNQVAGYAAVGKTCDAYGISVVEFDGTMSTAIITAHEIAHSLGASHVPSDPNSPCSSQYGFIMNSASSSDNDKRWFFSSCTATAILQYINSLGTNCLTDTTTPASTFQMADVANADILDVEKICQRSRKHTQTYFAHYWDYYTEVKGDQVCQELMCGEKGSYSCWSAIPSDGMICDENKRCDKGRCVATTISTGDIDANCVFGDIESEYIYGPVTCQQYVGNEPHKCYTEWTSKERCCATCKTKLTNIEGCEYGDRNPICKSYTPAQVCPSSSAVCCETCHGYVAKRSADNPDPVDINDASDLKTPPPQHPVTNDDKKKKSRVPTTTD